MRNRMLTAVFGLVLFPALAAGQSEWLAANGTGVALEFRHPVFDETALGVPDDGSMLNGGYFLSGRFQLPLIGLAGVAEIPFAHGSFGDEGDQAIGNVYIGGEMPLMLGLVTVEAGLRLPTFSSMGGNDTTPTFAGFVAGASSAADRYDAFVDDLIGLRAGVKTGFGLIPMIDLEANLGAAYMIFTGDGAADNDFMVDYGIRGFATPAAARIGLGVEGAAELTGEEGEEFDERSTHQLGMWFDYGFGMLRPGVSFFMPLDDSSVDYIVGLSLEIDLPM